MAYIFFNEGPKGNQSFITVQFYLESILKITNGYKQAS